MFKKLLKSFVEHQEPREYELTAHDLELKEIWDALDPEIKEFAKTSRNLGLAKICFNERGMAELVFQLNEIGYEIKKK